MVLKPLVEAKQKVNAETETVPDNKDFYKLIDAMPETSVKQCSDKVILIMFFML